MVAMTAYVVCSVNDLTEGEVIDVVGFSWHAHFAELIAIYRKPDNSVDWIPAAAIRLREESSFHYTEATAA